MNDSGTTRTMADLYRGANKSVVEWLVSHAVIPAVVVGVPALIVAIFWISDVQNQLSNVGEDLRVS